MDGEVEREVGASALIAFYARQGSLLTLSKDIGSH